MRTRQQRPAQKVYVYDDVTYVYDDVTYVYDDVTYVYDDVTYVHENKTAKASPDSLSPRV